MKPLLSKLTGSVLDLLFPMECFGCRKEGEAICSSCLKELPLLKAPYCKLCGQPGVNSPCASCRDMPLAIDGIRAPFILEGPVRHAVHGLKYRNLRAAAPDYSPIEGGKRNQEEAPQRPGGGSACRLVSSHWLPGPGTRSKFQLMELAYR